jgi:hypothetical protein
MKASRSWGAPPKALTLGGNAAAEFFSPAISKPLTWPYGHEADAARVAKEPYKLFYDV